MVLRQLLELAVPDPVGPRVPDVAYPDHTAVEESDGDRRPHARGGGVARLPLVDPAIRLLHERVDVAPRVGAVGARLPQRRGREARGDLARLRAADPVGDREQRRLADVGVLVVPAAAAGVGGGGAARDLHESYLSSVSPTRTTSPGVSRFGRVRRIPFR